MEEKKIASYDDRIHFDLFDSFELLPHLNVYRLF